jgi:undecaprenyl-diphosphatase
MWLVRRFRDEEHRRAAEQWIDRQLQRPALRPLAALLRPAWRLSHTPRRFLWNRVTPGDLGLEVTTLAAVAAVGSFAFFANVITLGNHDLVGGDAVTGAATLVASLVLVWRRRLVEAATLIGGLALTWAAVHIAKASVDRARPSGALVDVAGQAFPSAHAAYAVAWVAIAMVLTRTLPGLARTTAAVVVAVLLAVAIALSRVYLRAHYLSDVVGGVGLGATIYAVCGMAALVVVHVRHNGVRA